MLTAPTNGVVTLNPDGSFTYAPNADYNGPDSFTYQVDDGNGGTATATVNLTVNAINDDPVAVDDVYATDEDTPLVVAAPGVLANDTDADGDLLAVTLITPPAHGFLTLNADGSFTYTPNLNYNGPDSFVYGVSDGNGGTATATVNLTVNPVNNAPVANDDAYVTDEDTPLAIPAPGVLANDVDVDGDALSASILAQPAHGVVTLNPNGSFTYSPNPDYNGPDSFVYGVSDGNGGTATGTVNLTVNPVNDPPVVDAGDDTGESSYDIAEGGVLVVAAPGVLANVSDADGDTLVPTVLVGPTHGVVTLNLNGSFTYVPNPGYSGSDSFTYQVDDGNGGVATGTITVQVNAVNDAPVAVDDVYTVSQNKPLVVAKPGLLANDSDSDSSVLGAVIVTRPSHGTLATDLNGAFLYIPNPGFSGTDTFTYRTGDGTSYSNLATVSIVVTPSGPHALGVQRLGYHFQPTRLIVNFDSPMDSTQAQNLANYTLTGAGRDQVFGTRDDQRFSLRSARYDPVTRSVTLTPYQRLWAYGNYALQLRGTGSTALIDANGVPLDGDNDQNPGGDQQLNFGRSALAPVAPSLPYPISKLPNLASMASRPFWRLWLARNYR